MGGTKNEEGRIRRTNDEICNIFKESAYGREDWSVWNTYKEWGLKEPLRKLKEDQGKVGEKEK